MSSEWELVKDPATAPQTTAIDMDLLRKVLPEKSDEKLAQWLKVLNDEEIETAEDARPLLFGNGGTREEWNKLPLPMAIRAAIGDHLVSILSPVDAPPPCPGSPSNAPEVPPPASPKAPVVPSADAPTRMLIKPVTEFPSIEAGNTAQEIYAMAHLQAPKLVDLEQRKKPLAISAVIDVSGSMSGGKLQMAKDSLSFMIDELTDRDELGIVTFHTDLAEPLPITKMDAEGKARAHGAVREIAALNRTFLSGGMVAGVDQVRGLPFQKSPSQPSLLVQPNAQALHSVPNARMAKPRRVPPVSAAPPPMAPASQLLPAANSKRAEDYCCAVLVFTDGEANVGVRDEEGLVRCVKDKLAQKNDFVLHTFGFGADHNARMLQRVAETGSGSYYFIQDVATMKESFADCLGGLMSTVAQNIQLRIQAMPGFDIDRVMSTFPVTNADGCHTVAMRDLYSDEKRDVLVKLKMLKTHPSGSALDMVTFTVQYDSLISGKTETEDCVCKCDAADTKCTLPPNTQLDEQRARIVATETLAEARRKADEGNVREAQLQMQQMMQQCKAAPSASTAYMQAMCDDMDEVVESMSSASVWASRGSKAAATKQSGHAQQRMNRVDEEAEGLGYDNSFKCAMRKKSRKS